jgi:crotonobetainyl-CoA:carnitine CoA-transferase CaiB-like acyl-CoA transferase
MKHEWDGAPWDAVASALQTMPSVEAVERAEVLGIPAARSQEPRPRRESGVVTAGSRRPAGRVVVDLSSLWAGPLCARVLAENGLRVLKVEHAARPDGARSGPPEFWHRLNGRKEQVTLDFASADERAALDRLLDDAAVVVTSARPRALQQLALGLRERVRDRGLIWVSITGYGLDTNRVAFGDDAAVAGGLAFIAGGRDTPVFVGDAPADPLAGLHAADEAMSTMQGDVGAIIDVSMRDAIAHALTPRTTALVGGK